MSDSASGAFETRLRPHHREFQDPSEERAYLDDAWTTFGARMRTAIGFAVSIASLGIGATVLGLSGTGDITVYTATRIVFFLSLVTLLVLSFRRHLTTFVAPAICFSITAGAAAWVLPRIADSSVAGPGVALLFAALMLLVLLPTRFWYTMVATTTMVTAIAADFALADKPGEEIEFSAIMLAVTLIGTRMVLQNKRFSRHRYFARRQLAAAIEELRRTEAKVEQQAARQRAFILAMDQGVAVLDRELNFIAWNPQFERIFELPERFMQQGKPFHAINSYLRSVGYFGQRDVDERHQRAISVPRAGDHFELPLPGGRYLDVRRSGLPDGGIVTTYADITERKRAENLTRLLGMQDPLTHLSTPERKCIGSPE